MIPRGRPCRRDVASRRLTALGRLCVHSTHGRFRGRSTKGRTGACESRAGRSRLHGAQPVSERASLGPYEAPRDGPEGTAPTSGSPRTTRIDSELARRCVTGRERILTIQGWRHGVLQLLWAGDTSITARAYSTPDTHSDRPSGCRRSPLPASGVATLLAGKASITGGGLVTMVWIVGPLHIRSHASRERTRRRFGLAVLIVVAADCCAVLGVFSHLLLARPGGLGVIETGPWGNGGPNRHP